MALKPTIFKFNIVLSDLNRDYYDTLNLTLAQHPSETTERMMTRLMAFCLNAQQNLSFTKGLSEIEQPDIWRLTLDDQIDLWVDVGEPDPERIKKATHKAQSVKVYSFNSKSDVWWEQGKAKFERLNCAVYRFDWESIQLLASTVQRTMAISVMLTGNSAYITMDSRELELSWIELKE